ncbi:uncharacterized protein LY79DRAFT_575754 [Colletotrichum navitas]|uniref:Uncharacterized protein n=1 Tax=Colletotrichum navitas TaxID=681940 RepID=A0AAD8VBK3_9PEZI|nr:uncharacterized protein LY79DRAFT_575754 [Colletotrichum navitas]KAK1598565.1 hypothetical protein LY79DRAFT_575754 [Colletotrichum navitas]
MYYMALLPSLVVADVIHTELWYREAQGGGKKTDSESTGSDIRLSVNSRIVKIVKTGPARVSSDRLPSFIAAANGMEAHPNGRKYKLPTKHGLPIVPDDYFTDNKYKVTLDKSEAHCFVGRWSILHRLADWKRTWARIIVDEAHQGKKDNGKMYQNLIRKQSNAIHFVSATILANHIQDLTVFIKILYCKM